MYSYTLETYFKIKLSVHFMRRMFDLGTHFLEFLELRLGHVMLHARLVPMAVSHRIVLAVARPQVKIVAPQRVGQLLVHAATSGERGFGSTRLVKTTLLVLNDAMNRAILLIPILLLSACAEPRDIPGHLTYAADGSAVYAVTCDKPFSDEAACEARAGQICEGFGYKVVSRSGDLLSLSRSMTIRCNTASGLYPGDDKYPPR